MRIQEMIRWLVLLGMANFAGTALAESPPLASAKAVFQESEETWTSEGVVEAVNQATVTSKTAGTIIELNFDVNDFVRKGDVLLRFKGESNAASLKMVEAGLKEAQARFLEAQKEHSRAKELFDKKMVTASQMDQAVAGLNAAQARVEAARAQTVSASEGVSDTVIRAPYSGYVIKRFVNLGENASVGSPLFTGLSLESLRVNTSVPQQVVPTLRKDGQATVQFTGKAKVAAQKIVVFPYADPQTRQFSVRVTLPDGLEEVFPGELVKVNFVTGQKKRLTIPAQAVVMRGETAGVYLLNEKGEPSLRHILPGKPIAGETMEVLAGLTEGDTVATQPIQAGQALFQARKGATP